ncbi:MAG: hypothetical protein KatS3mg108_3692 [Isosphaeraceae bacterium]|jgi:hypothetical protein|nr:MAG: hypothetical protein KatS3mg108_3692 [Isosphaeraceae bacterium]
MAAREPAYRIVVFDTIDNPEPVREWLVRNFALHPTDAARWVARMPGVSELRLDERTARDLIDGLYELEIAAEARREDNLPSLAPAVVPHTIACRDQGFLISGLRGEPTHWIPWDKVEVIDAGLITQPDELRAIVPPGWVTALRNGLNALLRRPSLIARRERSIRIVRDPVGEIVLVRRDPTRAFRLVENALNYAYLGDRLRPSASENFPLLLDDLCTHAQTASLAPSTRAFREGRPAEEYTFSSSQALLDDALVRLLWRWYRRDRDEDLRAKRAGDS